MTRGVERARLARGMWVHTNDLADFCKDAAPLPKVGSPIIAAITRAYTFG